MWFKNAITFRVLSPVAEVLGKLENLAEFAYSPCGPLDPLRFGFTPPIPGTTGFFHSANGVVIFATKREEKILPASVIRAKVQDEVKRISDTESRPVSRKEREAIKDEIIFKLLPNALSKINIDYAMYDTSTQLLIVDTSSRARAEDICSKLREALGGLRCLPLHSRKTPVQVMTNWVQNGEEEPFEIGKAAVLQHSRGGTIRIKDMDLDTDQVNNHIAQGMSVSSLQLAVKDQASFILGGDLSLKRIKFADLIIEQAIDSNPESLAEQFDADFCIMANSLRIVLAQVVHAMGGVESEE